MGNNRKDSPLEQSAYPAKVVEAQRQAMVEQRVLRMAGFPRRLVVGPKTLFASDTALKSSPQCFAYAFYPRMTKAEAMQRMMDRFG